MELKNYYKVLFSDQKEYFIESDVDNIMGFLTALDIHGEYIPLQRQDGDPVYFKSNHMLSVQKAREGVVGAQTKLWRLV